MGKITGFLEYEREDRDYEPVAERMRHWREFVLPLPDQDYVTQAARCMNCGVPYCMGTGALTPGTPGCPVNNQIPDWNDLVYQGNWDEAARNLHSTNNFPEVTGRVCPAPCEASCTLNIDENPVTIKSIECAIADRAIAHGLKPEPAAEKTGKKVAIVGSGPAGLACAQQLARAGHEVHVYEKYAKAGGLLRYGIPDFKMEKHHIDRRVAQMQAEGVVFHYGAHVGDNVAAKKLVDQLRRRGADRRRRKRRATCRYPAASFTAFISPWISCRSRTGGYPANRPATASRYLPKASTSSSSAAVIPAPTASALRSARARSRSPISKSCRSRRCMKTRTLTWPNWPLKLRTSSSHEEGAEREFAVMTTAFSGDNGAVKKLHCVHVDDKFKPMPGSEFEIEAELVLLAMGFVHPVHEGMLKSLNLELDRRGNVAASTDDYKTSVDKVFAAGDMRRGQSLVVWAIREGRQAAHAVDKYLMGSTLLPR